MTKKIQNVRPPTWDGCETMNSPKDRDFLIAIRDAGFDPYRGSGSLFGGRSVVREVNVVHRGRGRYWEVAVYRDDNQKQCVLVEDLNKAAEYAVEWLSLESRTGEAAVLDKLRGIQVRRR